ncbi:unnamed protein product [Symbiodinium pilosum]|uniref:Uncharacterized protein n=1 Tax=Symbiodinium pilosum TaxID=2952 RepID=A0A812Y0G3_SYMPI|nr:unnamed protein product [Symbiodinium pilosum]
MSASAAAASEGDDSSSDPEAPKQRQIVGKAVQRLVWADVKHRIVKKSRQLGLATRTMLQAHTTTSSGRLTNKFDKQIAGQLQSLDRPLSKHAKETRLLREHAKLQLLEKSAPLRAEYMEKLKQLMKQRATADPDMWNCIKGCYESLIDTVWEDIQKEIELNVELAWMKFEKYQEQSGPTSRWFCCYIWVRNFVLKHYLPFDKSLFGKLKDPLYIALTFAMLIPNAGFRVSVLSLILIFILFPWPPDEFQLINFILLCKGTQFITGGLLSMSQGSIIYLKCFTWHDADLGKCISERGPGQVSSLALAMADYLGSIVLVWIAFLALPYAREQRAAALAKGRSQAPSRVGIDPDRDPSAGATDTEKGGQGGRLASLLKYDVTCFAISLLVLVVLTLSSYELPDRHVTLWRHLLENIFWCKVLYSLLSMPFSLFTIQPLQQVLTHAAPTGFNAQGACVPFSLPEP